MPKARKVKAQSNETLEQKLWKAADKLRKNIDAAEYKHIALGLIFLKYISDAFEELHLKLVAGEGEYEGADPEDADEYKAENVFFVPAVARWSALQAQAKLRNRAFAEDDIQRISGTYREWKRDGSEYADMKGFCKSAVLADIEKHNFVLTPGRYVGIPDEEDDGILFEEKMGALTSQLAAQMREAAELDEEIKIQLAKVGFDLEV